MRHQHLRKWFNFILYGGDINTSTG